MRLQHPKHLSLLCLLLSLGVATSACEDEPEKVSSRGLPGGSAAGAGSKDKKKKKPTSRRKTKESGGAQEADDTTPEAPKRPKIILTRDDFSPASRDPFRAVLDIQDEEPAAQQAERQRKVKLATYNFEDLRLVAIVDSGRKVQARALFVASDGRSKTIHQGEYFSRAEVLLASVNKNYVEVEVVDEDLARGMNLQRGERRAIYLKSE